MIIYPAIDIKDGECVRLYQGVMKTAEKVASDALETALSFKAAGAKWLHMVDLNGAISGKRVNSDIFLEIAKKSGLKVQLGGGIRTIEDIEFYLEKGISRLILGSAAIVNPALVEEALKLFGDKIAVGIDAKGGKAASDGWVKDSGLDYIELAKKMEGLGVACIIYTDIGCDGMLKGPNLEQLDKINNSVSCDIIASGGVTDLNDIKELKKLQLYGAICGRSIYSGSLDLKEAVAYAQGPQEV
ncbi:MAG: 1-(5-phosphoribosyl)-5-[(5-phosphoribosylamino)methylideneamino]imidazole-4-carboxamide isomerase [Clostridiales bacterium]|nr:1-(5-phosphoribosyl)-5-[(5-phosphoribosylamino)methylideneamino]imidazole-4-carboxamide isomerase [Clostridiales bacterium]